MYQLDEHMATHVLPAGNKRKLRVLAQPNVTLSMQHVPPHCRRARVALLGPLMPEDMDAESFVTHRPGALASPLHRLQAISAQCS